MKTVSIALLSLFIFFFQPLSAQTFTAEQLYKERRSSSQTFDDKYFNKTFSVKGIIKNIIPCTVALPGFKNVHQIALTGTGYEIFIICQIPFDQKEVLDQFKVGQVLTVTGTYSEKSGDHVLLNNCSFIGAEEPNSPKKDAPLQIPLGNYSVYQQGGAGFAFQYEFILKSYTSYTMNGKSGSVQYDNKAKVIRFTSGLLKGFAGIYRPVNPTNKADPPTILLDAKGKIPDMKRKAAGYQYAYHKG